LSFGASSVGEARAKVGARPRRRGSGYYRRAAASWRGAAAGLK